MNTPEFEYQYADNGWVRVTEDYVRSGLAVSALSRSRREKIIASIRDGQKFKMGRHAYRRAPMIKTYYSETLGCRVTIPED